MAGRTSGGGKAKELEEIIESNKPDWAGGGGRTLGVFYRVGTNSWEDKSMSAGSRTDMVAG